MAAKVQLNLNECGVILKKLLKLSLILATIRLEKCFVLKKAVCQAYFPKKIQSDKKFKICECFA